MPIASVDDYIAARKQSLVYYRTNQSRSISTLVWGSLLDLAGGNPSGGVLAGTDTTAGVVPTSSTTGFPFINSVGSQRAYLTMVDMAMSFIGRARWYDLLWKGGAYPFNANVTLSAQPSYASRLIIDPDNQPSTSIYAGSTGIFVEGVTASSGTGVITVTYTNQAGTTGRTTGAVTLIPTGALQIGSVMQLPLQAGDSGVQKIESVVMTGLTAGTFNILVMRYLGGARIPTAPGQDILGFDRTGAPLIFDTTALYPVFSSDSGSIGLVSAQFEVASK